MTVSIIGRKSANTACWRRRDPFRRSMPQSGFTLIELLVVFTILALLLTLATPRYLKTVEAGKNKVQAQNIATLRDAIDKFRADQGRYPTQLHEIVAKQYLRQIPLDPVSGTRDWKLLPSPNSAETGVYDIQAPEVLAPLLPLEQTAMMQGGVGTAGLKSPSEAVPPAQAAEPLTSNDLASKP